MPMPGSDGMEQLSGYSGRDFLDGGPGPIPIRAQVLDDVGGTKVDHTMSLALGPTR
jgi:hypothetical protein